MNTSSRDGAAAYGKAAPQQRVFTRVPFEHNVEWSYAPEERGLANVRNISRGGVCLTLTRYFRPGRVIRVHFEDILYRNRPIAFSGRIAWCKVPPRGEDLYAAGLAVDHKEPVVLAEMSEIFYTAVSRLRSKGVCPTATLTLADTLNSPSLAS